MSVLNDSTDSDSVEVQKTVTVVAYLKPKWDDLREWANEIDEEHDYYQLKESVTRKFKLGPIEKTITLDEEWEELMELEIEEAEMTETRDTVPKWSKSRAARTVMQDFLDNLNLPPGYEAVWGGVRRVEDETKVIHIFPAVDHLGLIKHPSKMDPEDPFEDKDAELPAMKFRVSMDSMTEEEMDKLHSAVVKPFITYFNTLDYTGRIRWFDCETKKTEKGACFRL